jgi:hypothetical protein
MCAFPKVLAKSSVPSVRIEPLASWGITDEDGGHVIGAEGSTPRLLLSVRITILALARAVKAEGQEYHFATLADALREAEARGVVSDKEREAVAAILSRAQL